jgi:hypothetical protein
MFSQSKLILFRPLTWKQTSHVPELTDAISEECDKQIKNWLNLADAAFKKNDDKDHAA